MILCIHDIIDIINGGWQLVPKKNISYNLLRDILMYWKFISRDLSERDLFLYLLRLWTTFVPKYNKIRMHILFIIEDT